MTSSFGLCKKTHSSPFVLLSRVFVLGPGGKKKSFFFLFSFLLMRKFSSPWLFFALLLFQGFFFLVQTHQIPVVFIWFPNHRIPSYHWYSIDAALSHHNSVIFMCEDEKVLRHQSLDHIYRPPFLPGPLPEDMPPELLNPNTTRRTKLSYQRRHFEAVNISKYSSEAMTHLSSVYKSDLGMSKGEIHNLQRFFLLYSLMVERDLHWISYLDSDVLLLTQMSTRYVEPGCDSMIRIDPNPKNLDFDSYYWTVWAGTSILRRDILSSFLSFATEMYSPTFLPLLTTKREQSPFVCDMTHWYLFSYCVSPSFRNNQQPSKELPNCGKERKMCDLSLFDYKQSARRRKFKFNRTDWTARLGQNPLLSVHYQGLAKGNMGGHIHGNIPWIKLAN